MCFHILGKKTNNYTNEPHYPYVHHSISTEGRRLSWPSIQRNGGC